MNLYTTLHPLKVKEAKGMAYAHYAYLVEEANHFKS
jgi:hypothetical protein